jgi:(p)ppGpp synthase/HD superfamily hydrolase
MTEQNTAPYARLDEALVLSREAHGRHMGRDGLPYFAHVGAVLERTDHLVALIPEDLLPPADAEAARILATLHDIVEEKAHTGVDADDLLSRGYDPRVVAWVVRLSGRPAGVTYIENIRDLARQPDLPLILVKLADNDHNMDPGRIAALPPEARGIEDRYRRSFAILADELRRRTGISLSFPILASRPAPAFA